MKRTILTLTIYLFLTLGISATELNVASYNIWMSPNGKTNAWQERKDSVARLVRFHDFDVFGTQEGFFHQLDDIKLDDGVYDYVAAGRDDGKKSGETSAVFYKKDKFELLDSGSFWFAETPDKPVKGWDALCVRICTWAKLKEKASGKVFFFFSCHFDHIGKVARHNSAILYVNKIEEITKGAPFIGVGDFNAEPNDEPIKLILASKKILDARAISQTPPYGTRRTWHGNNLEQKATPERIDYIFVSPNIKVSKYGVLTDLLSASNPADYAEESAPAKKEIRHPSDHFPQQAFINF